MTRLLLSIVAVWAAVSLAAAAAGCLLFAAAARDARAMDRA